MKKIAVFSLVFVFLTGCSGRTPEGDHPEGEIQRKTVWTAQTEYFLEYPELKAGEKGHFSFLLTRLEDFRPVAEGALAVTLLFPDGDRKTVTVDRPERPGIFEFEIPFAQAGEYRLEAVLSGKGRKEEIKIPGIRVAGVEGKKGAPEEKASATITLRKEQQWAVDFRTGFPVRRTVSASLVAAGEILPAGQAEGTVSAPVAGTLSLIRRLPYAGQRVSRGELLAEITPPLHLQGGLGQLQAAQGEARNRVALAQKEVERAQRLYEAKAAPKRRWEEAELALENARAAFEPLDQALRQVPRGAGGSVSELRSPLSGTVVELYTANGKTIEAGQPLLRIIDTSRVWLRANVPAAQIGGLTDLHRATFTIPGVPGVLKPDRLVVVQDLVDPKTRTVPVIYEVRNDGRLKIGLFAEVVMMTGPGKPALTLPEDALLEDEGRFFVFIQQDGESFERREVQVGLRGDGRVQILAGVKEDERVVLKGGYYVKLASLSARLPQGHAGHNH